jgi:putative FmdB family regulatory protein
MPTYDYECGACGHRFEVFQRMSDPKLEDCPKDDCGGRVRRLLGTGAGLIFKGSGFYQTDYRSDSYRSAQKSEGKGGEGKPAEGKPAEGKPAEGKGGEAKPALGKPAGGDGSGSSCGCAAA